MPATSTRSAIPRTSEDVRVISLSKVEAYWLSGWMIRDIAERLDCGDDQKEAEALVAAELDRLGYAAQRYSWSEKQADEWVDQYNGTSGDKEYWSIADIARYSQPKFSSGTVLRAILIRGGRIRHVKLALRLAADQRKREREARKPARGAKGLLH